jgi:membrane fusion protein, macrolide-specific efflux system
MLAVPKTWPARALAIAGVVLVAVLIKKFVFPAPPAFDYLTAVVTRADLENAVLANGIIKASRQVSVGAQVSGQIKRLNVVLGQSVKKGDLVAEIDPSTQQNDLLTAQAQLQADQAQLQGKLAVETRTRLALARQNALWADQATPRADLESAQAEYDAAVADVGNLQASIRQARVSVDTARVNLGYTRIVAPIDGVVVSVPVEAGQTVNASQSTPTIVQLAQLDHMTVKAEISEGDVTRVKAGMPAYFTILGDPDHRYETTLRSIDPGPESLSDDDSSTSSTSSTSTSSSSSSTTAIYYYGLLDVTNPGHTLRINMTAQVSIVLARAHDALTIPAIALRDKKGPDRYTVRVLGQDKRVSLRTVKIGLNNHVSAEVLSGLKAGERVIIGQQAAGTVSEMDRPPGGPGMGM